MKRSNRILIHLACVVSLALAHGACSSGDDDTNGSAKGGAGSGGSGAAAGSGGSSGTSGASTGGSGGSDAAGKGGTGKGGSPAKGGSSGKSAGATGGTGVGGASASAGSSGASPASGGHAGAIGSDTAGEGGSGVLGPADWKPSPMPLISRNAPAFASGSYSGTTPANANDDNPSSAWVTDAVPGWLAYDLSSVPVMQRQQVLVAWYDQKTQDYISQMPADWQGLPTSYSFEINHGDGGGDPPADGWTQVASKSGNNKNAGQFLIDLAGANWVRMSIAEGSGPQVAVDLDVHSAPDGASDDWLFMGDSITVLSLTRTGSNLPSLVHDRAPDRWPAIVPAGFGGTNTSTALGTIDEELDGYPGRFVVLSYGTNDHNNQFQMEDLVKKVLAAGKIPAIPHQPWTDVPTVQADGILNNQDIDALYAKYPEILHGPDLWALFENRTDLIASGDIHPNSDGQELLREAWADAMTR
jgi:hypothetical protein